MKINQQPDNIPALGQVAKPATARAGQSAAPVGKGDRKAPDVGVTVSSQARALERSDNASDIDTAKVNAVRQSIEQKNFVVNAEAIADKLLANAREMLDRSKG